MTVSKRLAALAVVACAGAFTALAHAAAPVYAGQLSSGSFSGSVAAESGPFGTPEAWSLWTFNAPFMSEVSISLTPADAMFDPIIAVWYGVESDTANYFDMNSGSVNTVFVAGADGIDPFAGGGPGEPAALSFNNIYGSERFVLAIADYSDGLGSGRFDYSITASVPEPGNVALMLAGLAALALVGRARRTDDRR